MCNTLHNRVCARDYVRKGVSVISSSRWLDFVRTFSALSGHSQKPFWFLLLLIFATAVGIRCWIRDANMSFIDTCGAAVVARCYSRFHLYQRNTCIPFILHSFSILLDDRSKTFCKTLLPHSAIQSFLIQMRISTPVLNPLRTIRIVVQYLWF